jgi:phosphoglycerate dehydrogenase-like enzyme
MKVRICLSIEKMDAAFEQMYDRLSAMPEAETVYVTGLSDYSLKGFDIFIGKKMSEEILATQDRLKAVFAYKTGVDDFPLKQMKKLGIQVVNSHVDADYIAQYAFGLAISLSNRITEFDRKFREGIWYDTASPYWRSFFEMKIGLVGYGHIGKEIHGLLTDNHIEAYTLDRGKDYPGIQTVKSLEDLCDVADMLILSLPKTENTNAMINADILKKLKGKYLVNVGRGNCIDQQALYDSLRSRELLGAAIDTWDKKPIGMQVPFYPTEIPFQELDNIVLSPHQAMRVDVGHERYVTDITVVDLTKGY